MELFKFDTSLTFKTTYVIEAESEEEAKEIMKKGLIRGDLNVFCEETGKEIIIHHYPITTETFNSDLVFLKDDKNVKLHSDWWMGDQLINRRQYG